MYLHSLVVFPIWVIPNIPSKKATPLCGYIYWSPDLSGIAQIYPETALTGDVLRSSMYQNVQSIM
jgi:hypothetical protein